MRDRERGGDAQVWGLRDSENQRDNNSDNDGDNGGNNYSSNDGYNANTKSNPHPYTNPNTKQFERKGKDGDKWTLKRQENKEEETRETMTKEYWQILKNTDEGKRRPTKSKGYDEDGSQ